MEMLRTVQVNVPQTQVRGNSVTSNSKESTLDLDSYSYTCLLGANSQVIQDHSLPVNVFSYNPALEDRTYKTVISVIGYDHPVTGQTCHQVIHQAISIHHLEHHLLCSMQVCVNDVTIYEIPKFIYSNLTNETQSIIVTDPIDPPQRVILPLAICGVTTSSPTQPITKE